MRRTPAISLFLGASKQSVGAYDPLAMRPYIPYSPFWTDRDMGKLDCTCQLKRRINCSVRGLMEDFQPARAGIPRRLSGNSAQTFHRLAGGAELGVVTQGKLECPGSLRVPFLLLEHSPQVVVRLRESRLEPDRRL